MTTKRWLILLILCAAIAIGAAGTYRHIEKSRPTVISVAMFCDGIWGNVGADNVAVMNSLVEKFQKSNSDIVVKTMVGLREEYYTEWLSQKIINGETPDIITVLPGDFNTLSDIGVLKNLDAFIDTDESFDKTQIRTNVLETGKYNGSFYALPREVDTMFMFVNETLLSEEQIEIPENDWTWDDFERICRAVTKDTNGDGIINQFGTIDFTWQVAAATNGVTFFDEYGTMAYFDTPEMIETIDFIAKLNGLTRGAMPQEEDFNDGRVAFKPFPYSWYQTFKASAFRILKYNDFEWNCVKLPRGPSGKNAGVLNSHLVAINDNTRYPNECWEFLKFIVSDEEAQAEVWDKSEGIPAVSLSYLTSRQHITQTDDFVLFEPDVLDEVIRDSQLQPRFLLYDDCMKYADRELYRIIHENRNVPSALATLNSEIKDMLKERTFLG